MKILVIRFSSIGDIVLTTPVVRALKQQLPGAELHYITKKQFAPVLKENPYIDKLITIEKSIQEVLPVLQAEKYDVLIDLHRNIRTLSLKLKLGVKSYSFPKLNWQKWLLVNFKINHMPDKHIVERYFEPVEKLGVKNDLLPCDYFIPKEDEVNTIGEIGLNPGSYAVIAIGAQFATKQLPFNKLTEVIDQLEFPIVLSGGPSDQDLAERLLAHYHNTPKKLISTCGKFNLGQSASLIRQAAAMLANDTGMMHVASCFEIPTVSVWGNTVPELGMYPYFPQKKEAYSIHEVSGLSCRPCSKIGYQSCPKKHFNCMQKQDSTAIASDFSRKAKI